MDKASLSIITVITIFIFIGSIPLPAGDSSIKDHPGEFEVFHLNVKWLSSMVREVNQGGRDYALVQSYEKIEDRCWIYDQALAVMAFTAVGKIDLAKKILNTLVFLQNRDGSFDFSYIISSLESTSKRTYTGSNAWIAMALNFYRVMTGDTAYNVLLWKTLQWIGTRQVLDTSRPTFGGVSLGVRDDAFSMEHNLDAYSAFYHYHNRYFRKRARMVKKFILKNLYRNEDPVHFMTGFNDHSLYLDCQSWAVLALGTKYCPVLSFAETHFLVRDGVLKPETGIQGFFERKAQNAPVWSEGTEGMALAYHLCGQSQKGDFYHLQLKRMMGKEGGISYATENNHEFSTSPSVAGTSWFLFYQMKFNPFTPTRAAVRTIKSFLENVKRYQKESS
jgi:hypothetical protein